MLQKLKKFQISTKPTEIIDDVICDGKGWTNKNRGLL